jgi:hypothetical protein
MNLEFKKYEGAEGLEELGTVAEQVGDKGAAKWAGAKNWNSDKRVTVVAINEAQESTTVVLSKPLSAIVRKARADGAELNELLAMVVNMPLYGNDKGIFIGLEGGEATQATTIKDLKKVKKSEKLTAILDLSAIPTF